jgi:4-oxalocrotonate tautomerase
VGLKEKPAMPTIHVELFAGRTLEQKRALAQALTDATVKTLGGSADGVDVVFVDVERHNWSTGGQLWHDKAPAPKP